MQPQHLPDPCDPNPCAAGETCVELSPEEYICDPPAGRMMSMIM